MFYSAHTRRSRRCCGDEAAYHFLVGATVDSTCHARAHGRFEDWEPIWGLLKGFSNFKLNDDSFFLEPGDGLLQDATALTSFDPPRHFDLRKFQRLQPNVQQAALSHARPHRVLLLTAIDNSNPTCTTGMVSSAATSFGLSRN